MCFEVYFQKFDNFPLQTLKFTARLISAANQEILQLSSNSVSRGKL